MIPLFPPTQGRRANCHHYLLYFLLPRWSHLHNMRPYFLFLVPCTLQQHKGTPHPDKFLSPSDPDHQTKPHNNHTCYSSVAPLQHAALQQDSPIRNHFPAATAVSTKRVVPEAVPSDLIATTLLRQAVSAQLIRLSSLS